MKTIVWEPMTGEIYGEYENLDAAKEVWNISENDDFFEERNGELWIALID